MNALGTVAVAFGFGAALIGCATMLPFGRRMAHELWSLYRSEFMIVGCLLLPAAGGKWTFLLLLLAIEWRGQFELFELFDQSRTTVTHSAAMGAGVALVGLGILAPEYFVLAFVISVVAVLTIGFVLARSVVAPHAWLAASSLLFPTLLIALAAMFRARTNGFVWVLLVYATVEMNDAFALVVGKLIGHRALLPRLSPNKTLEGLLGGFVVGGVTGYSVAKYVLDISTATSILVAAIILAAGLVGDLACSALKRWRNKKDFTPIAIAHGGVLDIYDSFLFAAPTVLLLRMTTGL